MLGKINSFRTGNEAWYWNSDNKTKTKCKNLGKLKYDYNLEQIAMQRAAEIAFQFSHERTDGTDYGEPQQGRLRSNGNHSPSPHQPQPVAHEAEITHWMLHHSIHTDHQDERG